MKMAGDVITNSTVEQCMRKLKTAREAIRQRKIHITNKTTKHPKIVWYEDTAKEKSCNIEEVPKHYKNYNGIQLSGNYSTDNSYFITETNFILGFSQACSKRKLIPELILLLHLLLKHLEFSHKSPKSDEI